MYNPSEKDFVRLNFILVNNNLSFDEMSLANETLETKQSSLLQNSVAVGLSYERKWSESFTTKYEFKKTTGSYDVFGIDFLVRKQVKNISSWFSYSYMDNMYLFKTLEDKKFPSNFDITHSFTFGTTYSNNNFNISAGLNYRTGKPSTVPLLGTEIIDEEINFNVANNTRIPDYFRIDASARYKFKIFEGLKSEIGMSVLNALNKINVINNYYRIGIDNNINKFSRESLGLTTNFMVRLYF